MNHIKKIVDLCLHNTVDGLIVGGVRDVRRHMDGLSHLKTERARENTKGGVGQYGRCGRCIQCHSGDQGRDHMDTIYRREESSICHLVALQPSLS